jgi:DNA-binding transcriptional ArsR family regulator
MVAYDYRVSLDVVFKALADKSRRKLLDRLFQNNGQTLNQLCAGLDMTRQAVTKHLALLERANLVAPIWRGREKLHYLNPVPIQEIADRWINKYERARLRALADLKARLEDEPERKKDG